MAYLLSNKSVQCAVGEDINAEENYAEYFDL